MLQGFYMLCALRWNSRWQVSRILCSSVHNKANAQSPHALLSKRFLHAQKFAVPIEHRLAVVIVRADRVFHRYVPKSVVQAWRHRANPETKKDWREDVAAFAQTCRKVGLPFAFEKSRSGTWRSRLVFLCVASTLAHRAKNGLLPIDGT
jgi:hypothetical protein